MTIDPVAFEKITKKLLKVQEKLCFDNNSFTYMEWWAFLICSWRDNLFKYKGTNRWNDKHKWTYHAFKLMSTQWWTYLLNQQICINGTITNKIFLQQMGNDLMKSLLFVIHKMSKYAKQSLQIQNIFFISYLFHWCCGILCSAFCQCSFSWFLYLAAYFALPLVDNSCIL